MAGFNPITEAIGGFHSITVIPQAERRARKSM
jgi:hypothetical protein